MRLLSLTKPTSDLKCHNLMSSLRTHNFSINIALTSAIVLSCDKTTVFVNVRLYTTLGVTDEVLTVEPVGEVGARLDDWPLKVTLSR